MKPVQNMRKLMIPLTATWIAALATACSVSVSNESTTGIVQLSVVATGEARDTAFQVTFDSDTVSQEIFADRVTSYSALEGTHSIELGAVASNCAVSGDNPVSVDVVADEVYEIVFEVTCTSNGNARITIKTTGEDLDDMYTLDIGSGYRTMLVGPNQFVTLSLPVGSYSVALSGLASNCTASSENPVLIDVIHDETTATSFAVVCVAR